VHIGPVKFSTCAHLIVHVEGAFGQSLSCTDKNSNVCLKWFEGSGAKFRAFDRGVSLTVVGFFQQIFKHVPHFLV